MDEKGELQDDEKGGESCESVLLKKLQSNIPFLKDLLSTLPQACTQYVKIKALLDMVIDADKFGLATLQRFDEVIANLLLKTKKNIKQKPSVAPHKSDVVSENREDYKGNPSWWSPPSPPTPSNNTLVLNKTASFFESPPFQTDASPMFVESEPDSNIRSPDSNDSSNGPDPTDLENYYDRERPSIYASAAESINKPRQNAVAAILPVVDTSRPPISVEDLALLTAGDEATGSFEPPPITVANCTNSNNINTAISDRPKFSMTFNKSTSKSKSNNIAPVFKQADSCEEPLAVVDARKSSKVSLVPAPLLGRTSRTPSSSGLDSTRADSKSGAKKSSVDGKKASASSECRKVKESDSIFGSVLSSLDQQIISTKKQHKERRKSSSAEDPKSGRKQHSGDVSKKASNVEEDKEKGSSREDKERVSSREDKERGNSREDKDKHSSREDREKGSSKKKNSDGDQSSITMDLVNKLKKAAEKFKLQEKDNDSGQEDKLDDDFLRNLDCRASFLQPLNSGPKPLDPSLPFDLGDLNDLLNDSFKSNSSIAKMNSAIDAILKVHNDSVKEGLNLKLKDVQWSNLTKDGSTSNTSSSDKSCKYSAEIRDSSENNKTDQKAGCLTLEAYKSKLQSKSVKSQTKEERKPELNFGELRKAEVEIGRPEENAKLEYKQWQPSLQTIPFLNSNDGQRPEEQKPSRPTLVNRKPVDPRLANRQPPTIPNPNLRQCVPMVPNSNPAPFNQHPHLQPSINNHQQPNQFQNRPQQRPMPMDNGKFWNHYPEPQVPYREAGFYPHSATSSFHPFNAVGNEYDLSTMPVQDFYQPPQQPVITSYKQWRELKKLSEAKKSEKVLQSLGKPQVENVKKPSEDKKIADKLQVEKAKPDKVQGEKAKTDKVPLEIAKIDKVPAEKAKPDKVHADKAKTDKVHADKAKTDKVPVEEIVKTDQVAVETAELLPEQAKADTVPPEKSKADQVPQEKAKVDKVLPEKAKVDKVPTEKGKTVKVSSEKHKTDKVKLEKVPSENANPENMKSLKEQEKTPKKTEPKKVETEAFENIESDKDQSIKSKSEKHSKVPPEIEAPTKLKLHNKGQNTETSKEVVRKTRGSKKLQSLEQDNLESLPLVTPKKEPLEDQKTTPEDIKRIDLITTPIESSNRSMCDAPAFDDVNFGEIPDPADSQTKTTATTTTSTTELSTSTSTENAMDKEHVLQLLETFKQRYDKKVDNDAMDMLGVVMQYLKTEANQKKSGDSENSSKTNEGNVKTEKCVTDPVKEDPIKDDVKGEKVDKESLEADEVVTDESSTISDVKVEGVRNLRRKCKVSSYVEQTIRTEKGVDSKEEIKTSSKKGKGANVNIKAEIKSYEETIDAVISGTVAQTKRTLRSRSSGVNTNEPKQELVVENKVDDKSKKGQDDQMEPFENTQTDEAEIEDVKEEKAPIGAKGKRRRGRPKNFTAKMNASFLPATESKADVPKLEKPKEETVEAVESKSSQIKTGKKRGPKPKGLKLEESKLGIVKDLDSRFDDLLKDSKLKFSKVEDFKNEDSKLEGKPSRRKSNEETEDHTLDVEGDGPPIEQDVFSTPVRKSKLGRRKKTELDRLHEDINETMGEQVLSTTRRARLSTTSSSSATTSSPNETNVEQKTLDSQKTKLHNSKADKPTTRTDELIVTKTVSVILEKLPASSIPSTKKRKTPTIVTVSPEVPLKRQSLSRASKTAALSEINKEKKLEMDEDSSQSSKSSRPESVAKVTKEAETATKRPRDKSPQVEAKKTKDKIEDEEEEAESIIKKRKINSSTPTGIPEKVKKVKTKTTNEIVVPTKDYYLLPNQANPCRLCQYKGTDIIGHYIRFHPDNDVSISRLSIEKSLAAIEDSVIDESNKAILSEMLASNLGSSRRRFNYVCIFCDKALNIVPTRAFHDHLASHTGEYRYSCALCDYKHHRRMSIKLHRQYYHKDRAEEEGHFVVEVNEPKSSRFVPGYMCSECHFLQLSKENVEEHIKVYHLEGNCQVHVINMSVQKTTSSNKDNEENEEVTKSWKKKESQKELEDNEESEETGDDNGKAAKRKLKRSPKVKKKVVKRKRMKKLLDMGEEQFYEDDSGSPLFLPSPERSLEDESTKSPIPEETIPEASISDDPLFIDEGSPMFSPNSRDFDQEDPSEFPPVLPVSDTNSPLFDKESLKFSQNSPKFSQSSSKYSQSSSSLLNSPSLQNSPNFQKSQNSQNSLNSQNSPNSQSSPYSQTSANTTMILPNSPTSSKFSLSSSKFSPSSSIFSQDSSKFSQNSPKVIGYPAKLADYSPILPDNSPSNSSPAKQSLDETRAKNLETPVDIPLKISPFLCANSMDDLKALQAQHTKLLFASKAIEESSPRSKSTFLDDLIRNKFVDANVRPVTPSTTTGHSSEPDPDAEPAPAAKSQEEVKMQVMRVKTFEAIFNTAAENSLTFLCVMAACHFKTHCRIMFREHFRAKHAHNDDGTAVLTELNCQQCDEDADPVSLEVAFDHLVWHVDQQYRADQPREERLESEAVVGGEVVGEMEQRAVVKNEICFEEETNLADEEDTDTATEVGVSEEERLPDGVISINDDTSSGPKFSFKIASVQSLAEAAENITAMASNSPLAKRPKQASAAFGKIHSVRSLAAPPPLVALSPTSIKTVAAEASVQMLPPPPQQQQQLQHLNADGTALPQATRAVNCKLVAMCEDECRMPIKSQYVLKRWRDPVILECLFKCPDFECEYFTGSEAAFDLHLNSHDFVDVLLPCIYCKFKMRQEFYKLHLMMRHANCIHGCSYCPYRALVEDYVEVHMRTEHPRCVVTKLRFDVPNFTARYRQPSYPSLISSLKRYSCKCGKQFYSSDNFVLHLNMCCRFGSEPLSCSCRAPFRSVGALLDHWRLTHSIFEYHCRFCPYGADTYPSIYRHIVFKHPYMEPYVVRRVPFKNRPAGVEYIELASESICILGPDYRPPKGVPVPVSARSLYAPSHNKSILKSSASGSSPLPKVSKALKALNAANRVILPKSSSFEAGEKQTSLVVSAICPTGGPANAKQSPTITIPVSAVSTLSNIFLPANSLAQSSLAQSSLSQRTMSSETGPQVMLSANCLPPTSLPLSTLKSADLVPSSFLIPCSLPSKASPVSSANNTSSSFVSKASTSSPLTFNIAPSNFLSSKSVISPRISSISSNTASNSTTSSSNSTSSSLTSSTLATTSSLPSTAPTLKPSIAFSSITIPKKLMMSNVQPETTTSASQLEPSPVPALSSINSGAKPTVFLVNLTPNSTLLPVQQIDPLGGDSLTDNFSNKSATTTTTTSPSSSSSVCYLGSDTETVDVDPIDPKRLTMGLTRRQLFKCRLCNVDFDGSQEFFKHISTDQHAGKADVRKPYVCPHCDRSYKGATHLLDHIRIHGPKRISCGLCNFKATHYSCFKKHFKVAHNYNGGAVIIPAVKDKKNPDEDFFIARPMTVSRISKDSLLPSSSASDQTSTILTGATSSSTASTNASNDGGGNSREMRYDPSNLHLLPIRPIFKEEARCATCGYANKVRTNFLRHMSFHQTGKDMKNLERAAPINPVPCLERNELMFDKMVNLAASSHVTKDRVPVEDERKYPQFVADHRRYVCGATGCNYLCLEEQLLKHHLQALHDTESAYLCVHCNEDLSGDTFISIDAIMKHLRLHESTLYKCPSCPHLHNSRTVMDRHVAERHSNLLRPLIVREHAEEKKDAQAGQGEAKKLPKDWKCGVCSVRKVTIDEIREHVKEKHQFEKQYKCVYCLFASDDRGDFARHFEMEHAGSEDILVIYSKVSRQKEEPVVVSEAFDTTPLWVKNRESQVKHIRGILLEEVTNKSKIANPLSGSKSSLSSGKSLNAAGKSSNASNKNTAKSANSLVGKGPLKVVKIVKNVKTDAKDVGGVKKVSKLSLKKSPGAASHCSLDSLSKSIVALDDDDDDVVETDPLALPSPSSFESEEVIHVSETEEIEFIDVESATTTTQTTDPIKVDTKEEDEALALTMYALNVMDPKKLLKINAKVSPFGILIKPLDGQYVCQKCLIFKTSTATDLDKHMRVEMECFLYECCFCNRKFYDMQESTAHFLDDHHISENVRKYSRNITENRKIDISIRKVVYYQTKIMGIVKETSVQMDADV